VDVALSRPGNFAISTQFGILGLCPGDQFGPSHSAFAGRAERLLVALPLSGDLFICAKDLFIAASRPARPKNDGGRETIGG
jgi:hypothetical protein